MGTNSFHHKHSGTNRTTETSKTSPGKNLSHVPCKFFRHGACQAGATCPFSHATDAQTAQAPCKYFQKGNCKFGVKCALAHILPDGRKVNPRVLAQAFPGRGETRGETRGEGRPEVRGEISEFVNITGLSGNYTTKTSVALNSVPSVPSAPSVACVTPSFTAIPKSASTSQFPPHRTFGAPLSPAEPFVDTFGGATDSPGRPATARSSFLSFSTSNVTYSPSRDAEMPNGSYNSLLQAADAESRGFHRRESHPASLGSSASPYSFYTGGFSAWPTPMPMSLPTTQDGSHNDTSAASAVSQLSGSAFGLSFGGTEADSAIYDVDDEDDGETFQFEEDFVPSALSDLLTPQELKRRSSKPSSAPPAAVVSMRKLAIPAEAVQEPFFMEEEHLVLQVERLEIH